MIKQLALILCTLITLNSCKEKSNLPNFSLSTDEPTSFENKSLAFVAVESNENVFNTTAKIKYRGGFSSQFEKKSFTVDLDTTVSIANLPAGTDWILNANYIDKTFLRHKLCFDLYRTMSRKNFAANCAYVTVDFNQVSQGLYVLMQQINATSLNLNKEDGLLFKEPPIFYKERLDIHQPVANYYDQKHPSFKEKDNSNILEEFKQFLFESNDLVFADSIGNWVDIENIIDWHLMLLLSNNGDGIMKNFYLYKLNKKTPFRIAIWDYDHSFCRDGDNEYNDLSKELNWKANILLRRLVDGNVSNYKLKLKDRWQDLRFNGPINIKYLKSEMEQNLATFEGVLPQNFEIWPVKSQWYYDDNDFYQEYNLMLECIEKRILQMDKYIGSF